MQNQRHDSQCNKYAKICLKRDSVANVQHNAQLVAVTQCATEALGGTCDKYHLNQLTVPRSDHMTCACCRQQTGNQLRTHRIACQLSHHNSSQSTQRAMTLISTALDDRLFLGMLVGFHSWNEQCIPCHNSTSNKVCNSSLYHYVVCGSRWNLPYTDLLHRVPQKTCDYIFYNIFNNNCPITIIFGTVSSKSMCHRKMVSFPTSPI